jgi:Uma2 family endonuclease
MSESTPALERTEKDPITETTDWTLPPEYWPKVDHLVTEDDTPVDNWYSEKQMRLLTEPLYTAWQGPDRERPFVVAANVGLYASPNADPLVPDVMLSLDVELPDDIWVKGHRVYFVWEFVKPPDVVIEIVSNPQGGEADEKMARYARIGIAYYVIYDPEEQVQDGPLHAYKLSLPAREYIETDPAELEGIGLGLTLWQGKFENREDSWLRWQDGQGVLIPTGSELSAQERQRAERLAARLRALGVDPDEID